MTNPSLALLLDIAKSNIYSSPSMNTLWVLDENIEVDDEFLSIVSEKQHCILTNRFDIFQKIHPNSESRNLFNEFSFSKLERQFDRIFYRISKEKFVVNHVLNQSLQHLKANGRLYFCGQKNEGIKGYGDSVKKKLNLAIETSKHSKLYLCAITKTKANNNIAQIAVNSTKGIHLDTGNFETFRAITMLEVGDKLEPKTVAIESKPGVYGWQKFDAGTKLLIESFDTYISTKAKAIQDQTVLDLGCGSGFLALYAAAIGFSTVYATDNNASAIYATKHNAQLNKLSIQTVASNCGDTIDTQFDYVICNPPFHKGFDTKNLLTEKFLTQAKKRLKQSGEAWFVVNSFVPLEAKSKTIFSNCETILNNKQFKILKCSN